MTNSFSDTTDPAALAKLVREGVECEACEGRGKAYRPSLHNTLEPPKCPTCLGQGRIPLANTDLDALAVCWCEGMWVQWQRQGGNWFVLRDKGMHWENVPRYTTDPVAAMRLMVKYLIPVAWSGYEDLDPSSVEELCRDWTEKPLLAALTEAIGE